MQDKTNTQKERQVGKKYAGLLQGSIRAAINQEQKSFSTLALKTKVVSRMKNGKLQRLALETTKHSFVHHYGFEGIRSNGKYLNLKEKNHLSSLRSVKVLNGLADEISSIRGDHVIAQINF